MSACVCQSALLGKSERLVLTLVFLFPWELHHQTLLSRSLIRISQRPSLTSSSSSSSSSISGTNNTSPRQRSRFSRIPEAKLS
ncbi:hypothetical protein FVER53590_29060 [Fusarium verticillioides]|nr:hypothetical protein FVER53590_29060 [Fusarium verticillioides]